MAAQVTVINTSFQRVVIKVTPGKYLSDVMEEACKHWNLNASKYTLKNNNKLVDLSRTFRQTGLSAGAKLELVLGSKSPSAVNVALQVQDLPQIPGGRLTEKFQSTTTFWMVLRKFENSSGLNLNFTFRGVAQIENGESRAGRIFYETPVLNVSGRELSSFSDLQKSLAQMGFNSGSCMIRLSFRRTDKPLEVATAEITQYFKEEDAEDGVGMAAPLVVPGLEPIPAASSEETQANADAGGIPEASTNSAEALVDQDESAQSRPAEPILLGPDKRVINVFAPPSGDTPRAALQPHNDADYEPTIAHAKLHQSRLQNNSHNQRLLSDAELAQQEEAREAKQASVKKISVKIRFPDLRSIQADFTPDDTGASLYELTRGVLVAKDEPFALVWTSPKGPQTVPDSDKSTLIRSLGFSGNTLVNFNWGEGASPSTRNGPVLAPDIASKARELQLPVIESVPVENEANTVVAVDTEKGKGKEGDGKGKGIPKWLKLGKK